MGDCGGNSVRVKVWVRRPKLRKRAKVRGVWPGFKVYKGLVVVIRKECGVCGFCRVEVY